MRACAWVDIWYEEVDGGCIGIWGDDAASEVALEDGGGRPGGAARPGGTAGERPGGKAGRPGGAVGTSLGALTGGDRGDGTSGAADAASESTATDEVGDREGGGGAGAGSLLFACFEVAGVVGRFGKFPAGVAGRDDACDDAFAAAFFRTSARAGTTGAVVEPDRCCRVVVVVRRAGRSPWLTAFVVLWRAAVARLLLLLFAQDAARGRPGGCLGNADVLGCV